MSEGLLMPAFQVLGYTIPLWVPLAIIGVYGLAKGKKEVALVCAGLLVFLFLFGSRLVG